VVGKGGGDDRKREKGKNIWRGDERFLLNTTEERFLKHLRGRIGHTGPPRWCPQTKKGSRLFREAHPDEADGEWGRRVLELTNAKEGEGAWPANGRFEKSKGRVNFS